MKLIELTSRFLLLFIMLFPSCSDKPEKMVAPKKSSETELIEVYPKISINPNIKMDSISERIVETLRTFLSNKNLEPQNKTYWKEDDFIKYSFPYQDILNIERTREKEFGYQPVILEILKTKSEQERILKIGFVNWDENRGKIRCIYNILIDIQDFKFKRILEYNTKNWNRYKIGEIIYIVSPNRDFDQKQAEQQNNFNKRLANLFEVAPKKLTYYSCVSPKEIFEIKGFDYIPNMYLSATGGLNEVASRIIFSGNDKDRYDHELVHNYLYEGYGNTVYNLPLLSEGLATYFGGSGNKSYYELRENLKDYLQKKENLNIERFLNPYSGDEKTTEISYSIGALICEYKLRRSRDFDEFLSLFEKNSLTGVLGHLNIGKEELLSLLKKELDNPIYLIEF